MIGNKVVTASMQQTIIDALGGMEKEVFKHLAIYGEEGSGKMSLVETLSHSFHCHKDSASQ
jgi:ABC-type molybdenum transport system ATPase subunit/photorepair protein PhrA